MTKARETILGTYVGIRMLDFLSARTRFSSKLLLHSNWLPNVILIPYSSFFNVHGHMINLYTYIDLIPVQFNATDTTSLPISNCTTSETKVQHLSDHPGYEKGTANFVC